MTTHTLTLTYTAPAGLVDTYWIRLEQEDIAEEAVTVAESAALLDALYQVDPCDSESSDSETTDEEPTLNDLAAAVEEVLDLSYCNIASDGSIEVTLRVIRSHLADPYTLRLQGGTALSTVQISQGVSVGGEISEELVLEYPVVSGFSCSPAPIKRMGNTLRFAATDVGRTYRASYQSRWDQVTVKIAGVDGKPGDCRALAFHHGLVDALDLEVPEGSVDDFSLCPSEEWEVTDDSDQVTCYQDVVVMQLCRCSDTEVNRTTYQQSVPCPKDIKCPGVLNVCTHFMGTVGVVERVACADDNQLGGGSTYTHQVSDPDYYRKVCCKEPSVALPPCEVQRTTYSGSKGIQPSAEYWRGIYGQQVRFVPVAPAGGICGEWIIRQQVGADCCVGAEAPGFGRDSLTLLPQQQYLLQVLGGIGPYTWRCASSTLSILSVSKDTTSAIIYGGEDFCGSAEVEVTDSCSRSASIVIRSTVGGWVVRPWSDPYILPDGFVGGPADDPGPSDLCGTFWVPSMRTSGRWQVIVSYGSVAPSTSACPEVPGDAGVITLISGLGMHPYAAMCGRYNCWGGSGWEARGNCCAYTIPGAARYHTYYQGVISVKEWLC